MTLTAQQPVYDLATAIRTGEHTIRIRAHVDPHTRARTEQAALDAWRATLQAVQGRIRLAIFRNIEPAGYSLDDGITVWDLERDQHLELHLTGTWRPF